MQSSRVCFPSHPLPHPKPLTHLTNPFPTPSGVGVGDPTASATSALLLSILQDSTGRLATILFAHKLGTALEPECKMYRLLADIFNDSAMLLDCLSPAFPKPVRVGVWCVGSVLRALCGVAAGSSKASLSKHFAKGENLGEVGAVSLCHRLCPFWGKGVKEADDGGGGRKIRVRRL